MSKIQDLRNPKRTIRSRLTSRRVTFDRLVDAYATTQLLIQYSIAAFALFAGTMILYGFLRELIVGLPTFLKLLIVIPFAIAKVPLTDLLGILASGVLVVVLFKVHCAYVARSESPTPRGRRILTADQALRSATKQSTNATTGKSRNRPKS